MTCIHSQTSSFGSYRFVPFEWYMASMPDGSASSFEGSAFGEEGAPDLTGRKVMVCEDEVMIAYDIAAAIEDAGGEVIGPFATVADAVAELDGTEPDLAVLDVNLLDGDVTPVLERLLDGAVPVVVNTGTSLPDGISAADVPVFTKPTEPNALLSALANRLPS